MRETPGRRSPSTNPAWSGHHDEGGYFSGARFDAEPGGGPLNPRSRCRTPREPRHTLNGITMYPTGAGYSTCMTLAGSDVTRSDPESTPPMTGVTSVGASTPVFRVRVSVKQKLSSRAARVPSKRWWRSDGFGAHSPSVRPQRLNREPATNVRGLHRRLDAKTLAENGIGRAPRLQRRPGTTRHVMTPPSHYICHRSPDLDMKDTTDECLSPDRPQIGAHDDPCISDGHTRNSRAH